MADENLNVKLTDLTVVNFLKAVADTVVSANAAQSNQIANQMAQQIDQTIGKLQSDLANRYSSLTGIKSDVDVSDEERIRSTAARDDAYLAYKTNVTDFIIGSNQAGNQGAQQSQLQRMVEASVNHYATVLSDERIGKAHGEYYKLAKVAQEQAHTDLAREDQWESDKEALVSAIIGEVVKSIQVPPAATEDKKVAS